MFRKTNNLKRMSVIAAVFFLSSSVLSPRPDKQLVHESEWPRKSGSILRWPVQARPTFRVILTCGKNPMWHLGVRHLHWNSTWTNSALMGGS
jgi:hypothetical protein